MDKSKIFLRDGAHGRIPSAPSERAAAPARTPRNAKVVIEIEDGRGHSPAAGANLDEGLLELGDDAHGRETAEALTRLAATGIAAEKAEERAPIFLPEAAGATRAETAADDIMAPF